MKEQFQYKELDVEGMQILSVIEKADRFNHWMYQRIKPFCKGRILEIGSGMGNISQFFIRDGLNITLSDIRDNYCEILSRKFNNQQAPIEVINIDLVDKEFEEKYKAHFASFDTVFALNVVEHIYDDQLALRNINKLLTPNGVVVMLVPAYQALYNGIDKDLEHYRRYTTKLSSKVIQNANFRIKYKGYFNAMGILAWYISGTLQKNRSIPAGQMELYNKLVPLFKLVDRIVFNRIGLSNLVVGQKSS